MAGSSARESQEVRVRDADGTPLTVAMARAGDDDRAIVLVEVDAPDVLLDLYFGRGERLVMVELPDQPPATIIEGILETWWISGERVWQVYVDRPLATLGPIGSVRPEPAARPSEPGAPPAAIGARTLPHAP